MLEQDFEHESHVYILLLSIHIVTVYIMLSIVILALGKIRRFTPSSHCEL